MQIVLCYPAEPQHLRQIAETAPDAKLIHAAQDEIAEAIFEADVFCGHAKDKEHPVSWADVVRQGRLRWIQSSAAGLDHCLTPEVIASDILVTGASGLFADAVAEQTLALLLGILRRLHLFFRDGLKRVFKRRPTEDLHGATVGIIGFGGNGRRLAQLLTHFRTRILATDYDPVDQPEYVEQLLPPEGLDELLPQCDIVILCVPLTAQTRGMIDAARLAQMKKGAVLINVARGPVVVEADLITALQEGHLGGAGLDVTEVEPLPENSPLWKLPNVIISPHVGAQSKDRLDNTTRLFCENLHRYLTGQPLLNVVDKQLGFARRRA